MKISNFLLLNSLVATWLFGYSSSEFYEKALMYEKSGDTTQAMKYYKMAFEQSNKEKAQKLEKEPIRKEPIASNPVEFEDVLDIKTHDLNYFLPATFARSVPKDDRKKFETKFSFSVKKPIFYNYFGLKESLNFAYSQTSWWQTARNSTPFRETNYRPEIFLNFDLDQNAKYIRFGLLHESNGRDGKVSRSWNRAYVQSEFDITDNLAIRPRLWTPIGDLSDNKDILKYVGYGDLRFDYKLNKHRFQANLRNNLRFGHKKNKGSLELGWIFPLVNDQIYGYIQYFTGYAESLIDYNRHTDKIGFGFAILK